jgi:Alpha amylase, C-terminal all-beta domain
MAGKDCVTNEATFNVAAEDNDKTSLLSYYRDLIHLRNEHSALRVGSFIPTKNTNINVYSFVRQSKDETVLVVINLGKSEVSKYALVVPKSVLIGDIKGVVLFGDQALTFEKLGETDDFNGYTSHATLAPYSTTIIQLQAASKNSITKGRISPLYYISR